MACRFLLPLLVCCSVAFAAWASPVHASTPFAIEPYLYVDPALGVTVAWAFAGETNDEIALEAEPATATFVDDKGRSHRVVPAFSEGV